MVGVFHSGGRWYSLVNWRCKDIREGASLIADSWEMIERAELLWSNEHEEAIAVRRALTYGSPFLQKVFADPRICEIVRDLFLSGRDEDAIAIIATELGMTTLPDDVFEDVRTKLVHKRRSGWFWR
jgi:hypothetical protein